VLAVLGATGYTGRLVVDEARRAGVALRLVGRRREALEELADDGEETVVADGTDEPALRAAFEGAFAVASIAGPFLEIGFAPVRAAIAAGAHYLDITGEQAFTHRVYDELGPGAADAGVVLLSAFGMDYVPGDLAARLAAEPLDEPLDEVAVAYSFSGAGTSRGTKRTMALLAGRPHLAWVEGALVESRLGATSRAFAFPFGESDVVEWGGAEPLTVPRHTRVATVRSYARLPKAAAKAAPLARPALALAAKVAGDGPSPEERAGARIAVVAEARRGGEVSRAALVGSDPYRLTALAVVQGVQALEAGEARGVGALAPAEAFDARSFLARLAPLLALAEPGV
jgi:short subunit dehydrogenase-like uncharacterized protein